MILARSRRSGEWNGLDCARNVETIVETLKQYADQGLRTLVMGVRNLDETEYLEFVANVEEASKAMANRDQVKSEW